MVIDFSAHSSWDTCPALWYEKYIHNRRRKWAKGQRDDAMALGSLVHEGLRVWQESHTVEIPQEVQDEVLPTRECLGLAEELVWGYTQKYPEERWDLIRCEEPVTFPLAEGVTGLAKIDSYFYVSELTEIESGVEGLTFTLSPGWWIHEYKTKSPFISMPLYMQGWEMGMQASYQITALKHKLSTEDHSFRTRYGYTGEAEEFTVQGILINVLEKPKRHVPKRKCRQCQETYEFYLWVPTGTGEYACPVCGNRQVLTALKEAQPQIPPAYYRIPVFRSPDELTRDHADILKTGLRMMAMERGGKHSEPWRKKSCVDFQWRRACDYFSICKDGRDSREDPNFETPPDYRGLIQLQTGENL